MKVRVPKIPRKTTSINSIRSAGGSRPTLDVFTELMAEANTDCAINRFPSRFVSSFVTLISFDWLTTFIHHFFLSLQVFARFYAEGHDSDLSSRNTYLLVTDLVRKSNAIGRLPYRKLEDGQWIHRRAEAGQDRSSSFVAHVGPRPCWQGRCCVVVGPTSAGLSFYCLSSDPDLVSWLVKASARLHLRYQEANLNTTIHFSDGTASPLRLTDRSYHNLLVESHNTIILVLTSPVRAKVPSPGRGTMVIKYPPIRWLPPRTSSSSPWLGIRSSAFRSTGVQNRSVASRARYVATVPVVMATRSVASGAVQHQQGNLDRGP